MSFSLVTLGVAQVVSVAGILLMLSGVVQLAVRKKTGVWKDGGANLLAGFIVIGVLVGLMVWLTDFEIRLLVSEEIYNGVRSTWMSLWPGAAVVIGCTVGFVLMLSGVVQLAVRKKTGLWKDGGANLLAGFIVAGVFIGLIVWLAMGVGASPS